jgi:hypothetical protein
MFIDTTDATPHFFKLPVLSLDRPDADYRPKVPERPFALPDFTFFTWPEPSIGPYDYRLKMIHRAQLTLPPLDQRINKIFFRGGTSNMRQWITDAHNEFPEYSELGITKWDVPDARTGYQSKPANFVAFEDACKFKYLLHTKGLFVCTFL